MATALSDGAHGNRQVLVNFHIWHETDMPTALRNVRSRGQSGKHVLALSFSGFDPKADVNAAHWKM